MNVLLIDQNVGRLNAIRSRFEAAGCHAIHRAWQIAAWSEADEAIEEFQVDLAVVHDTDVLDRATLAAAKIPVVVYSGGTVSLPEQVKSQRRVVPFPIPIDRGATEQQRRYIDYLVRSLAGKSPAEITSDLFDAKTRSFPYVYAMVLLARTRLALVGRNTPARSASANPDTDWWEPLRGPSGKRKELLSEIEALTNAAARQAEKGPGFLQRLHQIVQDQRWTSLSTELLSELEALLRLV